MSSDPAAQFSVIIPVYNGDRFLSAAIENVLDQEMPSIEIIVVDDGSTDNTSGVAHRYSDRIRYFYQTNRGPSSARNKGLSVAVGDYVAFLDCDDCWTKNNLKRLYQAHLEFPGTDIVMGKIQEERVDEESGSVKKTGPPIFSMSLPTLLAKRSAVDKIGMFDESIQIGEDKDWFFKAREKGIKITLLDNHVALYHRRHDSNLTNTMAPPETYLLKLLRLSLQRKKKENVND